MKKAIVTSLAALVLASSTTAKAEDHKEGYIEGDIDPTARLGVLGANLIINGTICGIASVINKRNVLNDIGICLTGATLQYAGMELGAHDVPVLPGFGMRITETGTSMIYNTLEGNEPLEKLQYGFGPGLIEINTEEEEADFYWRMLPVFGLINNIAKKHKFSIEDTLNYQTPVFHGEGEPNGDGANIERGLTTGNIFYYNPKYPDFAAHEFQHTLQYVRMRPFQLIIPKFLDDFEDKAHLRVGEDAAFMLAFSSQAICNIGGTNCGRYWWNLPEAEAYIMQTAHEQYSLNPDGK